ncbi:Major Facilitator Superfamily protein [Streptosporangium canum]|uniref:Major Facilitator Superfamily protein n=1 Tax=Streptosporangium canum TaxID=324952 RepID=A0A1I3MZI9_9ACTN|nr:MFS transporter [Streptosporangium canum]SFJ02399.1 Major Facilitator Superfamily protein [Streptosporangium canum]
MPPTSIPRPLVIGGFAESVGMGLFISISALYFNRVVGLTPTEVGFGLGAAGIVGIAGGVPLGYLSDRFRPRFILVAALVVQAVGTCLYLAAQNFWSFLAVAMTVVVGERTSAAARSTIIAGVLPRTERVGARAYLRAMGNVGVSAGVVAAAVALAFDTRLAYSIVIVINGATLAVSALVSWRLPDPEVRPRAERGPALPVLRDVRYALAAGLAGLMSTHYAIIEVALPLWVSAHTKAPVAVVPLLILSNTVLVIALQVWMSKGVDTPRRGSWALIRAGLLFLVTSLALAWSGDVTAVVAIVLLAAGMLAYTLGEILHASGSWALSFELAPADKQGQYQGMFGALGSGGTMLGPLLVTSTALTFGGAGWIALGVLLALAGLLTWPVASGHHEQPAPKTVDV